MDEPLPAATYAFGEFRLDARRVLLTYAGTVVALPPKAFALLEFLVRRPGRVVEKEALLAAVWPHVVVEEGNLSQTVYLLRRALRERSGEDHFIVTVPGRGYRFIADVGIVDEADVRPPAAVAAVPGRGAPPPAAVRAPERRSGTLAAGVALTVVALAATLVVGPGAREDVPARAPVAHAPAPRDGERDAALGLARFLFARRAPGDLDRSRAAFHDVLARDPDNAGAWAGLAGVWFVTAATGPEQDRAAGLRDARNAAERAIALDPGRAEAHARLAVIRVWSGDARGARASREEARRLDPDTPLLLWCDAEAAVVRGEYDAAVRFARRGVEREPMNLTARIILSHYLLAAGRPDEAYAEAVRAYDIAPVDPAAMLIGQMRLARGDAAGAAQVFAGLREPRSQAEARALLSVASRRRAPAEAALRELAARVGNDDPFAVAEAYALRGDRDRAFEWLERAAPSDGGDGVAPITRPRWSMRGSPLLAMLHGDPRWAAWDQAGVARRD